MDAAAATRDLIDSLGTEALAKAEAYTTGGHWLLLWDLLITLLVTIAFVRAGWLEALETKLARRGLATRTFLLSLVFLVGSTVMTLPWTLYAGWWRERAYGRSSQPLGDFLLQWSLSSAISSLLIAMFFVGVYALLRRTGRSWWAWCGGLAAAGLCVVMLLGPLLIEPLFNKFEPLQAGPVRTALDSMARDAGIPSDRIFVYDGSRQSNNFTANVSGIGSSARVAISDIALKSASLDEVKAVTGHEIGHYVLGHVWQALGLSVLLISLGFLLVDRLYSRVALALGSNAALSDARGLPVLLLVFTVLGAIGIPLSNTVTRHSEAAADRYSLRTTNLPDALAGALVKSAEYRYPRPSVLEEWLFYSHPSVERRVRTAMEWKATHAAAPAPSGSP